MERFKIPIFLLINPKLKFEYLIFNQTKLIEQFLPLCFLAIKPCVLHRIVGRHFTLRIVLDNFQETRQVVIVCVPRVSFAQKEQGEIWWHVSLVLTVL